MFNKKLKSIETQLEGIAEYLKESLKVAERCAFNRKIMLQNREILIALDKKFDTILGEFLESISNNNIITSKNQEYLMMIKG